MRRISKRVEIDAIIIDTCIPLCTVKFELTCFWKSAIPGTFMFMRWSHVYIFSIALRTGCVQIPVKKSWSQPYPAFMSQINRKSKCRSTSLYQVPSMTKIVEIMEISWYRGGAIILNPSGVWLKLNQTSLMRFTADETCAPKLDRTC